MCVMLPRCSACLPAPPVFNQDIGGWNVRNVTSMRSMFNGASAFNQDIGDWDVIGVTEMQGMFNGASAFNQDIGDWNVSRVTEMQSMFNGASAFNQDIGDWDVSNVFDMNDMFLDVALSVENYDALLLGWSTIDSDESPLYEGVTFHGGNSMYCPAAAAAVARGILADEPNNWTIVDGEQSDSCPYDASLIDLSLSPGSLSGTFDSIVTTYIALIDDTTSAIITAPTTNSSATVTISGIDAESTPLTVNGTMVSGFTAGANAITIAVTSQDETTTREYTVTVTLSASSEYFVTTWRTTTASPSITIPTFAGETYNYDVDWGDGDVSANQTGNPTHTYSQPGDYEVRIRGIFPRIYFNDAGDKEKIIAINQWGAQQWTSMQNAFHGTFNLVGRASDTPDLSNVTNMAGMFRNTRAFNQDIGDWDVSNVTNMAFMFFASAFNQDIGDWDVRIVDNMDRMFRSARAFNQDIGDWDVGSVINMNRMFSNASAFNQNIGSWDLSSAVHMNSMFSGASAFNQDIGDWDVGSVTNMSGMFARASAFNQDIGDWDVGSVEAMDNMFFEVALSVGNYSALLIGWSTIDSDEAALQSDVTFHGGSSMYCSTAATARSILTDTYGWNITMDGGPSDNCSSDASLSSLSHSPGSLNETFDTIVTEYSASVGSTTTSATITATTTDANATITIVGIDANGTLLTVDGTMVSGFTVGANTITIAVTAQDRDATQNYTITVTRAGPGDATLSALSLSNTDLAFVSGATNYDTSVATDITNTTITATPTDANATTITIIGTDADGTPLTVDGTTVSGLSVDDNTIIITVTAQDQITTRDYTITVTRATPEDSEYFITTWRTTIENESITIPTFPGEAYNYNVDWGDGNVDRNQTTATHIYEEAATYAVRISGDFPRIYFNNSGDKEKIIAINQWGAQQWTSMESAFRGAVNLAGQKATGTPDLSQVTNMRNMFSGASAFNQDIDNWDVSNVTDMFGMFFGASAFNQDIGSWDLSSATDTSFMFFEASAFNQDISDWNVSNVTNMSRMFDNARAFNQDIGSWDLSSATDTSFMFFEALAFNQNIGDWDVSSVTDMSQMFRSARAFNKDIDNWDVSSVTDMSQMFRSARAFDGDIGSWDLK